jgi:hypothetical protein
MSHHIIDNPWHPFDKKSHHVGIAIYIIMYIRARPPIYPKIYKGTPAELKKSKGLIQ